MKRDMDENKLVITHGVFHCLLCHKSPLAQGHSSLSTQSIPLHFCEQLTT